MAITANGNNITAVYANGTQVQNVYVNSSLIWSAAPSKWKNAWSGQAYITDFGNQPEYEYTYTFTGMSMANISNKTIQVDAAYYAQIGESLNTIDTLTAERNNNNKTTNLPWTSSGTLSALKQSGSSVSITGSVDDFYLWGAHVITYFGVSNIWYYQD